MKRLPYVLVGVFTDQPFGGNQLAVFHDAASDPATGIACGPLGAYLVKHGCISQQEPGLYKICSEQGPEMGRPSMIDIFITKRGEEMREVSVGGQCIKVGCGELFVGEE